MASRLTSHPIALLLIAAACGGDDGPSNDDGPADTGAVNPGSSEGGTEADSESGTMPNEVEQAVCAELVACVDAADDQPLTPILEQYGPNGTCWDEFEAEACWQDCETTLAPLREASCPDVAECCECVEDSDCTEAGMVCADHVCAAPGCELVETCAATDFTESWLHFCNNDVCTEEAHALLACLGTELGTDAVCGIVETTDCVADGECDNYAAACEIPSKALAGCIYG